MCLTQHAVCLLSVCHRKTLKKDLAICACAVEKATASVQWLDLVNVPLIIQIFTLYAADQPDNVMASYFMSAERGKSKKNHSGDRVSSSRA